MATATYYFNASVSGPTDSSGNWTDDANAFDGSTSTFAYDTTSNGNDLIAVGTNAPSSGGDILGVDVRVYAGADGVGADWSSYTGLSTPSGGWTWTKIQGLETRIKGNISSVQAFVYNGITSLGFAQKSVTSPPNYDAYRVELLVTFNSPPVPVAWLTA